MHTIRYIPNYQTIESARTLDQTDTNHPLYMDDVFIPPQRYTEYTKAEHSKHGYSRCPAWKQYWSNTFVFFNQMEVTFKWNKDTGMLYDTSFPIERSADYLFVQEGKDTPRNPNNFFKDKFVFQYAQSAMIWPEKQNKNGWIELIPFPDTYHKYGLELICADFPFGRWFRSVNAAYRCHATSITMPRGMPLYCVRFRGFKGNNFNLKRWEGDLPKDVYTKFRQHQGIKNWIPKKSWSFIKDDVEEESKCPFSFLWKK